ASAFHGHELAAAQLGDQLAARVRLDAVVIPMDGEQRTTDLAVHRLADLERRGKAAALDRAHECRAVGVGRPGDALLDLPGRMRFRADVAYEMLGEVGIVG